MNRDGLRAPDDMADTPLWSELNADTGMVATAYRSTDRCDDRLIVATYNDSVGLVTYYRADSESDVLAWLGLS